MPNAPPPGALGAAATQLAIAAAVGGAVALGTAAIDGGSVSPLVAVAVAAPALFAAELVARLASRHRGRWRTGLRDGHAERAVEELAESSLNLRSEEALAAAIAALGTRHLGLRQVALYTARGEAWRRVGEGERAAADEVVPGASVLAFLGERREPLAARELVGARVGEVRPRLEELFGALDADMLIPLVDRDRVLGAIAARAEDGGAALARDALAIVQQAASRTLVFLDLLREAETRVGVAREGEVAAAVQHAAVPGYREHVGQHLAITSHYQPAASFGGDFFSAAELSDGRTFVAIGDVAGRGMPAALISAAVAGACEAAERLLTPGASIVEIVSHFNRLVGAVGRERYAMSCFFALFEADGRSMTFADAGHPFPYVCRRKPGGSIELSALVARGVPLGLEAEPRVEVVGFELEEGDAIVLTTDAVVEALPPGGGAPYGSRRLRRLLRRRAGSPQLCRAIVDDVLAYCGERPLHDDMTVAVVRIGEPGSRRAVSTGGEPAPYDGASSG